MRQETTHMITLSRKTRIGIATATGALALAAAVAAPSAHQWTTRRQALRHP
jgi:hypothetical protein